MEFLTKTVVSALIIVSVSELGKIHSGRGNSRLTAFDSDPGNDMAL